MLRTPICSVLLLLTLASPASAVPIITAGNHFLLPYTPDQQFFVMIDPGPAGAANGSGGADGNEQTIAVVDLQLTVGDGTSGPRITNINLVAPGTVFGAVANLGNINFPPYNAPGWIVGRSTGTTTGETPANGILAVITVDTTNVVIGDGFFWPLKLTNLAEGLPTGVGFGDDLNQVILVDGWLTFLPEPGAFVLAGFGMLALGAVAVRRQRGKRAA